MSKKRIGAPAILFAALLWSVAGLLIRGTECGPGWLLVIRNGAAGVGLLPWLFAGRKPPFKKAARVCVFYTAFMAAFVISTRVAGAAATVAGQYTAPLFLYVLLVLQKKLWVRASNLLPMLCIAAGCGVGLFTAKGGAAVMLLPLLCGVLFPAYSAAMRGCGGASMGAVMCLCNLFCAVLALPAALTEPLPVANDAMLIAAAGILLNGLAYVVYGVGTQHTGELTSLMLCLVEPVMNPVWVWLLLGEAPSFSAVISLVLILGGGVLDGVFHAMRETFFKRHAHAATDDMKE